MNNNTIVEAVIDNELNGSSVTVQIKKDFAKILYLEGAFTQKEIAQRTGTSEQSLVKWIEKGNWKKLKQSLLTTKKTQLSNLYNQLEAINDFIIERGNESGGKAWADTKEADIISKLTASIRQLETESNAAATVDVFMKFSDWVANVAPQKRNELLDLQDAFIKSLL
jgi:DNA-binding XRE family transcriptional regulator